MNLLMLTYHFPPYWGGVSTQNITISRFLAERGHKVFVVTPLFSPEARGITHTPQTVEHLDSIRVHRVHSGLKLLPPLLQHLVEMGKTALSIIKRNQIDLIDAHEVWTSTIAGMLGRITGIPILRSIHGHDLYCSNTTLIDWCENNCIRFGFIKCVSCVGLQYFAAWKLFSALGNKFSSKFLVKKKFILNKAKGLGFDADRFILIPYWVNTRKFKPKIKGQNTIEPSLQADKRIVMYVGPVYPKWKGVADLINAAPHVVEAVSKTEIVIVGTYKKRYQYAQHLTDLTKSLGIEEKIRFVGVRPRQELPSIINSAEVLVFPSYLDNYNWTLIETLSCGKPVVATDTGGTREVIEDKVNGLLVRPRDPIDMSGAIISLLRDKEFAKRIGRKARQHILDHHDREKVLPILEKELNKVCLKGG